METGPEALKRLRRETGESQHDVAVAVGLTAGAISQFERGVHTPRRRVVDALDTHLGADGQIVAAFGYVTQQPDEVAELRCRVEELEQTIEDLLLAVRRLQDGAAAAQPTRTERAPRSSRR